MSINLDSSYVFSRLDWGYAIWGTNTTKKMMLCLSWCVTLGVCDVYVIFAGGEESDLLSTWRAFGYLERALLPVGLPSLTNLMRPRCLLPWLHTLSWVRPHGQSPESFSVSGTSPSLPTRPCCGHPSPCQGLLQEGVSVAGILFRV